MSSRVFREWLAISDNGRENVIWLLGLSSCSRRPKGRQWMRRVNVSLLTVSPVSHSVSQSGVLSLFPARNQFGPFSALVRRPLSDCCFTLFVNETSKLSDLCIVCCEVSYYCYRSCSFSGIDHGPKPRPCSKLLFRA